MDNQNKFNYYKSSNTFHGSLTYVMGTRCDVVMIGEDAARLEAVWALVADELIRLSAMLNRFDEASALSAVNRTACTSRPAPMADELWEIMLLCRHYYQLSEGLFDVTKSDFGKVIFDDPEKTVKFDVPGLMVDLGGFAKGYALRKVKDVLVREGVKHCLVDFGYSSILAMGHHPYGDSWQVSIVNPFDKEQPVDEFALRDQSLSVSGNTPNYMGHIVNPITQKVVYEKRLTCAVCRDPLDAEVMTTVLMLATDQQRDRILTHLEIDQYNQYTL